ncbi:hypothetical protein RN001_012826 [Aquatica leii]|uniref:Uncharacterized protein n=1 Tax=Aquatica leii TaxID=1421715 RepID=A0AAN7SFE9_9COLE|nr:hypothetical protein RN001_012826 [Aquatica leii]
MIDDDMIRKDFVTVAPTNNVIGHSQADDDIITTNLQNDHESKNDDTSDLLHCNLNSNDDFLNVNEFENYDNPDLSDNENSNDTIASKSSKLSSSSKFERHITWRWLIQVSLRNSFTYIFREAVSKV